MSAEEPSEVVWSAHDRLVRAMLHAREYERRFGSNGVLSESWRFYHHAQKDAWLKFKDGSFGEADLLAYIEMAEQNFQAGTGWSLS